MRSRLALAAGGALVVVGAAVAVPLLMTDDEVVETSLEEVMVFEDLPTTHVDEEVAYDQVPPAGGPHADVWLACGVYDRPVREENLVHALEHGTVWVAHDPDLSGDEVEELAEALPPKSIVSPYEGLPSPVVITVWGRQLVLSGVGDPGLEAFLAEFGDGGTAPEAFAPCEGGVERYEEEDGDTV